MEWLNETTIGIGLGVISSIAGGFKFLNVIRKRNIAIAVYHAYNIVEDIATADAKRAGINKTSEALRAADRWMAMNGWRTLNTGEQELAKLTWSSRHGVHRPKPAR